MNRSLSTYRPTASNAAIAGTVLRFAFAGKEKDLETGLSYFGARYSTSFRDVSWQRPQASLGALLLKRYYDADLTTGWLSVDPMADKYPGMSPYNYCAWNPVKLVDPDGEQGRPVRYGYLNTGNNRPPSRQKVTTMTPIARPTYNQSGVRKTVHVPRPSVPLHTIYDYGNTYQRTDPTPNDVLQRIYYSAQSALQILDNSPEYKKALQNLQFSVTTTQTSYYSENGVTSNSYTVISFLDGQVDAVFQKAQADWTKKYNTIIENNTIEANGYRGLNQKGSMSLIELGPSPYSQALKMYEDNKSEFKTSSEYKPLPVIRQAPLII